MMPQRLRTLLLAASLSSCAPAAPAVLQPDLARPDALQAWTIDGNGVWEAREGRLVLAKAGVPGGPIRKPAAIAVLRGDPMQRVTVDAEVRSTAPPEVVQRDLQIVFGYESPTRFYYVHLSAITDAVHNGIFLVADADRKRIDTGPTRNALPDQAWHRVRVTHDGATGAIAVYADDLATPVMRASDTTIRAGRVGVGSFDDTGEFRAISVSSAR